VKRVVTDPVPDQASRPDAARARAIDTHGLSMRAFAARGVVVNAAFDVGLSGLALVQGFVLAGLLTRSDYGVWGVLVVSLGVLARLKAVGIGDKYLQQDEPDQELAFQRAFTLEVLMTAAATVPLLVALPVIAVVYGHWKLVPPGLALVSVLAADALQAPFWIYYRRMNFLRQRVLQSIEPVVGFVVAVCLAVAGAGYWALAIGVVAGAWSGAAAAVLSSPYPLAWRYDRAALRAYTSFSAPILIATACSVVLANATMIAGNARLGLAGAGTIALAGNVTAFTSRLDDLVCGTLYPVICAVQNRLDLLRESFVKSNRLAMIWGMPFGVGVALFASDLVDFGVGHRWHPVVGLLRITGVVAAVSQIAFNWDDYFRARGDTVPLAVAAVASTAVLLGVGLPLLLSHGLTGLAVGIAAGAAVHLALRAWYVSRLFEGLSFVRHAGRALAPTIPAAAVVLAIRLAEHGPRTRAMAAGELAAFVVTALAATWLFEGELVREAAGYLFGRARAPGSAAS
jgi:O-antigen/teichoic acid export membrane protein